MRVNWRGGIGEPFSRALIYKYGILTSGAKRESKFILDANCAKARACGRGLELHLSSNRNDGSSYFSTGENGEEEIRGHPLYGEWKEGPS